MKNEIEAKNLTEQDRDRLSREIFNISRRLRQISNFTDDDVIQTKLLEHITNLNNIGTEIAGGIEVVMGKVLRA